LNIQVELQEERNSGVSMGSNIQFDVCIDELRVSNVVRDFQTASPVIQERKLLCYPNPTTRKVHVSGLHTTDDYLIFTSLSGSVLRSIKLAGQPEAVLDISNLPAGVYVMQVVGKGGTVMERIIREY
jgi:hypothetical protein